MPDKKFAPFCSIVNDETFTLYRVLDNDKNIIINNDYYKPDIVLKGKYINRDEILITIEDYKYPFTLNNNKRTVVETSHCMFIIDYNKIMTKLKRVLINLRVVNEILNYTIKTPSGVNGVKDTRPFTIKVLLKILRYFQSGYKPNYITYDIRNLISNPQEFLTEHIQFIRFSTLYWTLKKEDINNILSDKPNLCFLWTIDYFLNQNDKIYFNRRELNERMSKEFYIYEFQDDKNMMLYEDLVWNEFTKEVIIDDKSYRTLSILLKQELFINSTINTLSQTPVNQCPEIKILQAIEQYETSKSFNLNVEQKQAVIKTINNNFSVINGGAGTGKSTIVECIIFVLLMLKEIKNENQMFITAHTGCAYLNLYRALKLAGYGKINGGTVMKLLNSSSLHETFVKCKIVFIDEVSMVGNKIFYKLLGLINEINIKVVLIGDHNQLPSIEFGCILNNIETYSTKIPKTTLTVSNRQKSSSKLYQTISKVVNGVELEDTDFNNTDIILINETTPPSNIIETYGLTTENSKILSYFNNPNSFLKYGEKPKQIDITKLNQLYQKHYLKELEEGKIEEFNIRDIVIRKKNIYSKNTEFLADDEDLNIFASGEGLNLLTPEDRKKMVKPSSTERLKLLASGECLKIIKIDTKEYTLLNEDGETTITELKKNFNFNYDLGYCSSIHKSQGSQYDNVVVYLEHRGYKIGWDKVSLYTAITRAKKRCIIVGTLYNTNAFINRDFSKRLSVICMEQIGEYEFKSLMLKV